MVIAGRKFNNEAELKAEAAGRERQSTRGALLLLFAR